MILVMHMMIDVLSLLKKVSCAFQEKDATAADIHTQLSSVCTVLKKYQESDGPHLAKVNADNLSEFGGVHLHQQGRQSFQSTRHSVLVDLQMAMERRFDDSKSGVLNATQIVNLCMWPTEEEPGFGDSWVKTLAEHFEKPLKNTVVDCDMLQIEWGPVEDSSLHKIQHTNFLSKPEVESNEQHFEKRCSKYTSPDGFGAYNSSIFSRM